MFINNRKGFTLAETMIVLAVIGVIAVITVPALVNKHIESANRTKIKKAMTVYDTALNKMVIENGIKDNAALYGNANSFAPSGNCTNTAPYFRVSKTINGNICTFKAPDGLYWDISKINEPILAFKEDDLNDETSENRFQLVGHFDNTTGSLRVNDLQYETNANNKAALTKVYNYINNVKEKEDETEECNLACKFNKLKNAVNCDSKCKMEKYNSVTCVNPDDDPHGHIGCKNCKGCSYVWQPGNYSPIQVFYDENGNYIGSKMYGEYSSVVEVYYNSDGTYFTSNGDYITLNDSTGNGILSLWGCRDNNIYNCDTCSANYGYECKKDADGVFYAEKINSGSGSGSGSLYYSAYGSGSRSGSGSLYYSAFGSGSGW